MPTDHQAQSQRCSRTATPTASHGTGAGGDPGTPGRCELNDSSGADGRAPEGRYGLISRDLWRTAAGRMGNQAVIANCMRVAGPRRLGKAADGDRGASSSIRMRPKPAVHASDGRATMKGDRTQLPHVSPWNTRPHQVSGDRWMQHRRAEGWMPRCAVPRAGQAQARRGARGQLRRRGRLQQPRVHR